MKKFKLLILFFALSTALFYSCSDNNSIENEAVATKSTALRIVLNEFKKQNNISGRNTQTNDFCFDFVYPLTLSYNDGTTVSVASQDGLISLLTNENDALFVQGIVFPFQVVLASDNTTVTITNEADFLAILNNCNFETFDDILFTGPCYSFVYPFSLVTEDYQTIVISNEDDLYALYTNSSDENVIVDFVYPFSVIYNNQTVVINNQYGFLEMNNNCLGNNGCACPTIYAPVCVETIDGIIEFPSACVAECEGYTSDDFVDCNTGGGGVILLEQALENCLVISYPVQVEYNGEVVTVNSNEQLLQSYNPDVQIYPAFNYPLTVSFQNNPSQTYSVANQEALIELINANCN